MYKMQTTSLNVQPETSLYVSLAGGLLVTALVLFYVVYKCRRVMWRRTASWRGPFHTSDDLRLKMSAFFA